MNQFLTLVHCLKGKTVTWSFCINEVDGQKYYFARNHAGRVHAFSGPDEQTAKIRRFLDIGYTKAPFVTA